MRVIFTSTIKIDSAKNWYIELKDMLNERVELCRDMDEYAQMIEDLGSDYGGDIEGVNWYKDDDVPPHVMDEIRVEMARYQAQVESKENE